MNDTILGLYEVVKNRKNNHEEGSYTCYLFEKGIDKILKKCGEECAEMIIAAKNDDKEELSGEICDLIYHMLVMMAEKDIEFTAVIDELEKRRQKIGNLKNFHATDHLT